MVGYLEREQFNIGQQHWKTRIGMSLAPIPCKGMDFGSNSTPTASSRGEECSY